MVGEEDNQKEFAIHEAIICTRSVFFAKAMKSTWKEGEEKIVCLPEEDPDIAIIYFDLLYRHKSGNISNPIPTTFALSSRWCKFSQVYVLARKLMDDALADVVLNFLKQLGNEVCDEGNKIAPPMEAIQIIYDGTTVFDKARTLVNNLFLDHGDRNYAKAFLDSKPEDISHDFLYELAADLFTFRRLEAHAWTQVSNRDIEIRRLKDRIADLANAKSIATVSRSPTLPRRKNG